MKEVFKALYDAFYTPLPETELKQEIDACHEKLVDALDKQNRRLALQIIDDKDQIAEDVSIDSFIFGFVLASHLANEISAYSSGSRYKKDNER